ncbi:hypothetical protein BFJ72_g2598 [Fusarium proliferatum]|uniref:Uncharacterized protein n=1 Tax=Gibberella intermedia TaxID=948311 RepID=A0A420TZA7_GIBIN|nr:hypothetical protein BFJ72_g2598 [Fusarium proliferatum]
MESTDVRQRYNLASEETRIAASVLDMRPPFWNQNKLTSGMDCLLVVLRRIYSHNMLSERVLKSIPWLVQAEEKNPILLHAWHVFGRSKGDVEKATVAREKVEEALRLLDIDPKGSFEDLCFSSLMNETFWSQDVFRLCEPAFSISTGRMADFSPDEIAMTSLISNNNIDDVIGIHEWKGEVSVFPPSRPWIIRVMLDTSSHTDQMLPFRERRCLRIPIWKELMEEANLVFDITGEIHYHLLAVVRLRDKDNGKPDYVRTYSGYGANIVPDYEPISFMSKDWTLATPGKFVLFYGLPPDDLGTTDVTNFPEIHKARERDDVGLHLLAELMKTCKEDQKKAKAAQGQPATTSHTQQPVPEGRAPINLQHQSRASSSSQHLTRGASGKKAALPSPVPGQSKSAESQRSDQRGHKHIQPGPEASSAVSSMGPKRTRKRKRNRRGGGTGHWSPTRSEGQYH